MLLLKFINITNIFTCSSIVIEYNQMLSSSDPENKYCELQ